MSFKQQCGCQRHEELTSGKEFKIKRLSSRPYSKSDVERLISLGVLSSRATYLCDICASFGQTDNTEKNKRMKYNHIDAVVKDIEQGDLQEDDMRRLAGALGRSQHETFKQQSYDTTKTYKDSIKQFSIDGWVTSKNIIVSGFINELVGAKEGKSKQSVYIAAAIDCLMAATISNCITPLFFIFNIVSYFICGSKLTSSTLSAFTPSGSYTTLKNWLQGQMSNLCSLPSLNDIITYFDNNQVLSRNWRVRYDAKVRLSVITSVIHILTNKLTSLQTQLHLDPHTWLYRTQIQNETIIHRIVQFIKHCSSSFEVYRNKFIIERINKVYEEHSKDGKDFISTLIDNPDLDIPRGPTNDDPHSFLQHNHPDNPPTVVIGEPVMVNPCSYDSVKHVLQSLLNSIVTNTDRKWTIIGCDGLPYILASRLIDNDANLQHILLQPGLGHYEINMVKACFKLLWEVALSDLALLMGYKSIKAQVACKSASDHHKSWQLLQIFLYGTADELITPYILYCKDNNSKPSLSNYYEWLAQVKNSNYLFMQDVVFTYVYALFLFRSGVRRNNSEVLLAARTKFSPLFYGLNMTNYQEIDYRDIKMRLLAPPEIQNYLNENDSFSTSGHKSKGEGGDFVLENKNKSMKSLIPSGVPSEDVWLRACRTFDKLDGIRTTFTSELGITSSHDDKRVYHPDLTRETVQWRKFLRSTHYLERPCEEKEMSSVSGQILDTQLVKFAEHCKGNQQLYLEDISDGKLPGKGERLTPLHITKDDRQKYTSIQNKTMAEIREIVEREIEQIRSLGYEDEATRLRGDWDGKIRTQKKQALIMFYTREVLVALDEAVNSHPLLGSFEIPAVPAYYRPLSLRLFSVMDDIGASEAARKVRMECRVTREILDTVYHQPEMNVYYFGSRADGTTTLGMTSDTDIVRIFNNLPVVTDPSEHPVGASLLFIQDATTPAGYCKLQLVQNAVPQYGDVPDADPCPDDGCRNLLQFATDTNNRLVCLFCPSGSEMKGYDQRHGPALTRNASTFFVSRDNVYAVECDDITKIVPKWLTRVRNFNWPTDDMLEICKTLGCLFVPVGHPHSKKHNQQQQWRISLSQQEKLLVTQFNSVQFKCFILLKIINKEIIQKSIAESLSSYHIKTCMFFVIENTACELWKPENLLVCISLCLRKLLEWIDAEYCPNYFIPEENMFDRRIHGNVRLRLQQVLHQLVSADCKFLSDIQCDGLGERFIRYFLTPCITTRDDDHNDDLSSISQLREVREVCGNTFRDSMVHLTNICESDIETTLNQILKSICSLRDTTRITRHTIEATRKAKLLMLPYMELILMSHSVAYAVDQNKQYIWSLLTSIRWKEIFLSSDSFSSRLKHASMLYMLGYYQTSLDVLFTLTGLVRYTYCRCYKDKDIVIRPDDAILLDTTRGTLEFTPEYLIRNVIIPCVYFLPTEKNVAPAALCYEMERIRDPRPESDDDLRWLDRICHDWAFVDGNFLLYFLLYLSHDKLNMTDHVAADIDNMKRLLMRHNAKYSISHRETCLNLLGLVYYEQGNAERAKRCFTESLQIKPQCNAASQHMTAFSVSTSERCIERTRTAEGHS